MNIKRISTIALSNRDFPDFATKLEEACRWVRLAAVMGSDLAVLPEAINLYRGDGPNHHQPLPPIEAAVDDWQRACRPLLDMALAEKIAVVVPVLVQEGKGILNCFHIVSATGEMLGRYVKEYPTTGELTAGILPGKQNKPIPWEGLKLGGAICFDMNFPVLFDAQQRAGVDIFLCPSLFPGGDQMNHYAALLQRPVVIAYPAWSRIIDILGRDVVAGGYRHETLRFGYGVPVYTADINFDKAVFHFDGNQAMIEPILRRYGRQVRLEFDQQNMRFSLESRSADLTVANIITEFGLETLEGYLTRSVHTVVHGR